MTFLVREDGVGECKFSETMRQEETTARSNGTYQLADRSWNYKYTLDRTTACPTNCVRIFGCEEQILMQATLVNSARQGFPNCSPVQHKNFLGLAVL